MRNKTFWTLLLALAALGAGHLRSQERPTPGKTPEIVCFGDSLTAGYGLDPGQSYPDLLQKELDQRGYHYKVVSMGVSGETTQDGLARLSRVTARHPQIVILELGANDGLRGQPVSNAERNLGRMIEAIKGADAQVVLAGITIPPNYGPDYIPKFNAMFPDLAKRYMVPLIPFLLADVATNPDLMQSDGLHPNEEGTRIVVRNIMKTLQPLLRK
jgi:acyl-CoA thioesterase-1